MYRVLFILLTLCFAHYLSAQDKKEKSSDIKPAWIGGDYPKNNSNSYFVVVYGVGETHTIAYDAAIRRLKTDRSLATGMSVQVLEGDKLNNVQSQNDLIVKARVEDEYWEKYNGEYAVYLLCQIAKKPTNDLSDVKVTDTYGFSPRVFIPGMAQLHKGSTGKGIFFIASEALLVGGIVVSESLRASYDSKIYSTHDANDRLDYIDKADTMENVRNGLIAGAAAVYIWNVIDGIVAKGKKRGIALGSANLKVSPYATPNAGGFALVLNF
ncbi:hypothetical protein [Bacteroides sp. 519]|uniref:hypothetical protein n=1 Tax=Bacteroides sp. 519 TaxID=2302937 RepID=UPI0013D2AB33|nr:hypothetical protein [Bacteroides sp. 519]NDV59254.1 hypothetical protein [Bacteroides sp. 519]